MAETQPKVQFALGSEVSSGHFFKSSFARSFVSSSCRDAKSLDYQFQNSIIAEEPASQSRDLSLQTGFNNQLNYFYKLVNLDGKCGRSSLWNAEQPIQSNEAATASPAEVEKLRKQLQSLTEENERLQASLKRQPVHTQAIDSVYLQSQIDTLQWQFKQSESSRQMYRSLMEQVVRFLDRTRKSLDIISEKSSTKRPAKNSSQLAKEKTRAPRSRSVHAAHDDSPTRSNTAGSSCASSTTSSASSTTSTSSSSSRFGRPKSVVQIAPSAAAGGSKESRHWSAMRRNDPAQCTPPRTKPPPPPTASQAVSAQVMNETQDSVYKRPIQSELDPNDVPPEKLSKEAFRLMRTVQSLLVMRGPDLTRLPENQDSNSSHLDQPDLSSLSHRDSFVNSTAMPETMPTTPTAMTGSSSSERGTEGSSGSVCTDDELNRTINASSGKTFYPSVASSSLTLSPVRTNTTLLCPGARQSIDATSLNSASSKNTEDEDRSSNSRAVTKLDSQLLESEEDYQVAELTSTPQHRSRGKEYLKTLRDWALENSCGSETSRPKPATSVSSAEDESGFSSLSSFQEVGLPHVTSNQLAPIKGGCHTEVGLPEVPLDKIRHRRWSSTPAEFQAMYKRHSGSFASGGQTTESLSVWV